VLGCTAWAALADTLRAQVDADIIETEETAMRYLVKAIGHGYVGS
jgi:Asp/Glu/hydantoin racemase